MQDSGWGADPVMDSPGAPAQADRGLQLTTDLSDLSSRTQLLAFEHQPYGDPEEKGFLFLQLVLKTER